ncbi:MAG: sugar phosphate isomerase/epimerase [Niabella sp.]
MKRNRKATILWGLLLCAGLHISCTGGKAHTSEPENIERKYGWLLGAQAYTFKNFTFYEVLQKIDSCGLKYVEAYPNQLIGNGIEGLTHFSMDLETRAKVKAMLSKSGVQMAGYGVVKASGAEEWEKVFEFCKYMGVTTMTCEPARADLDIVSALCDKYQINAAIHNHPAPTTYWNPDTVLDAIKGRSARLGVCADIGHWVRSGLDPLTSLQKLKGHIMHFHFKDISQVENRSESEVTWGKGLCKIPAVMQEMKAQHFKGMISVEYEHNLSNNVDPVKESVWYFRNELK